MKTLISLRIFTVWSEPSPSYRDSICDKFILFGTIVKKTDKVGLVAFHYFWAHLQTKRNGSDFTLVESDQWLPCPPSWNSRLTYMLKNQKLHLDKSSTIQTRVLR